jgi:hypothetical protein
MSHASQQIRDWFVTKLTGVTGLPNAVEGMPRQIAIDAKACVVTSQSEEILRETLHPSPIEQRRHLIAVVLLAASLDAVDAMSVAAEEAIHAATGYPGNSLDLLDRTYSEDTQTDRSVVSVTLQYEALYFVARGDVETFK